MFETSEITAVILTQNKVITFKGSPYFFKAMMTVNFFAFKLQSNNMVIEGGPTYLIGTVNKYIYIINL